MLWQLPLVHGLICSCEGPACRAAVAGLDTVVTLEDDTRTSRQRALPALRWGPDPGLVVVPWGVERIGAPRAWNRSRGTGVRVAVVDTGADWEHPGLAGQVYGGINILDMNEPPWDDNGHGTHVAGIIAGADRPGSVVGVAPQTELYIVKAFDDSGSANTGDVLLALQWCADWEMMVVNMSFGQAEPSPSLERAAAACEDRGIVLTAAAGNGHTCGVEYPARYPTVLGIGASNRWNRRMNRSTCGPEVDLLAPGQKILSLRPGDHRGVLSGTSMATAHVSGAAALLLADRPQLRPAEVRQRLRETADVVPGRSEDVGAGLLRVDRALGVDE